MSNDCIDHAIGNVLRYLPSLLQWRHEVLGTMEQPSSPKCDAAIRECEAGLRVNVLRGVSKFADVLYYATIDDLRDPRVVMCFLHLRNQLRRSSWYEALKLIHGQWTLGRPADGPLATKSHAELETIYRALSSKIASVITPREHSRIFTWGGMAGKEITKRVLSQREGIERC